MCGKNNSGKSNILRALSLFFKNEVEPGIPLSLSSDCSAAAKEKKRISITVEFDIPAQINIQKTMKNVLDKVPRTAKIKKIFELYPSSPTGYAINYSVNDIAIELEDRIYVEQFLNLFNFRYITANRTPSTVLAENLSELRSELSFRLNHRYRTKVQKKKLKKLQATALESVNNLADELFVPVRNEITKADEDIDDVSISTPNDVTQLLNTAVYQIKTKSGTVLDEKFQGHGIQNVLLFTVLYLIDRNFHRKFGWKIATIWAVEEPETFLHFDLENQLAQYFFGICEKPQERFQLLLTSHSSVFPQYATSHYYVHRASSLPSSTNAEKQDIGSYMKTLAITKITNFPNLMTYYPNRQIILTEGPIDEYVLRLFVARIKLKNILVFSVGKFLGDNKKGGDSHLYTLLLANTHVLQSRLDGCGVVAIFDWDSDGSKLSTLKKHICEPNLIFHFGERCCNPLLDKSFRGIERFYDSEVIHWLSESDPSLIIDRGEKHASSRYFVDKARYDLVKQKLFERVKSNEMKFTYFSELENELQNMQRDVPELHLPLPD